MAFGVMNFRFHSSKSVTLFVLPSNSSTGLVNIVAGPALFFNLCSKTAPFSPCSRIGPGPLFL
jgi:hypothetical protein